jgi:hypothetical protein
MANPFGKNPGILGTAGFTNPTPFIQAGQTGQQGGSMANPVGKNQFVALPFAPAPATTPTPQPPAQPPAQPTVPTGPTFLQRLQQMYNSYLQPQAGAMQGILGMGANPALSKFSGGAPALAQAYQANLAALKPYNFSPFLGNFYGNMRPPTPPQLPPNNGIINPILSVPVGNNQMPLTGAMKPPQL